MQYVNAAIRANKLFKKNTDYVVKGGSIVIVDEFTGRTMPGRRWSEGLHQAIEAKEGLKIQAENQTSLPSLIKIILGNTPNYLE